MAHHTKNSSIYSFKSNTIYLSTIISMCSTADFSSKYTMCITLLIYVLKEFKCDMLYSLVIDLETSIKTTFLF